MAPNGEAPKDNEDPAAAVEAFDSIMQMQALDVSLEVGQHVAHFAGGLDVSHGGRKRGGRKCFVGETRRSWLGRGGALGGFPSTS